MLHKTQILVLLGGVRGGTTSPLFGATPTLTLLSSQYQLNPQFQISNLPNIDLTGYLLTEQIRTSGSSDWNSPLVNSTHTIVLADEVVNNIVVSNSIPVGSYEARVSIAGSNWSNTFSFTLLAWDPSLISPNAWFEPAKGSLFQSNAGSTAASANNDVVGYMPDQSGNSFTITSIANDTTRPTLQGVGANPYLSFDGTNDILRRAAILGGTGTWAAGAGSWFMAIRAATPAASCFMAGEFSTATNCAYSPIMSSTGQFAAISGFARNDSGGAPTNFFGNLIVNGAFDSTDHVIGVVDNGSSLTGYVDGVAGAPLNYTRGANVITPTLFALGARISTGTPSAWFSHRMYGGVFVNRVLTGSEIANLTTYLGKLQGRTL